uniref:DUF2442 domain-containing protein n=1 Tax=Heterorhabditis bacteriophora TaxID=37862 RepID=A0A1I7WP61_HETBA
MSRAQLYTPDAIAHIFIDDTEGALKYDD